MTVQTVMTERVRKRRIHVNESFLECFFHKTIKRCASPCLNICMKYYNFFKIFQCLKHSTKRMLFFIREYFFPFGCAICGVSLLDMNETWYGLCEACYSGLEKDIVWLEQGEQNRCQICGKPMVSGKGTCLSCRNENKPSYDRLISIFTYSGKYKKLFGAYKFGKNLALGHFFSELIFKAACYLMKETGIETDNFYKIVPVPPSPGKIRKTGWDQIEYLAHLIESGFHKNSNIFPVYRCLRRLKSNVQKKLDRKGRMENLKGRIILVKKAPITAIIIDDVITTGSTMEACAAVLKAGGTQKVFCICLVYD